ncbi:MFS transporter [Tessaracoccus rhinocerotis]|uniref:MFS transporter n=1 Tax=Tessaracoccus rhinocerotis TaxID=1689449 RepID=A0A553JWB5_9ACTN|nr:MFS transporter [Tessaracoccus rhinocerotis]TRY16749.1 MFS transporter [Tessaracoccus rhinocerotis]
MAITTPSREVRLARWGVALLFWLNGATYASLIPRYPELKQALDLSDTFWGLSIAVGPLGGLAAGLATAVLMRRFNSANVAVLSQVGAIVMINVVGNAPAAWVFAGGLFLMSAFDAVTDISMNAHGLRVQRGYGRSILNSFHAWWSIGAVCGGFLGSTAAQLGIPIWAQALVLSVLFLALDVACRRMLLDGPDREAPAHRHEEPPASRLIPGPVLVRLAALGVLAAAAGLIEDTAASWGAIYMDRAFVVVPFVAGMAFVALQGTQMLGRFMGDGLVDRFGPRGALVQGTVIAAVGMGLALTFPSAAGTIIGFACAGWGVATVIPSAMHAADELPGMRPGTGLTIVTWLLRLGFLAGPPLIGAIGDATSLRWALFAVPACAVVMLALNWSLRPLRLPRA